jgi:hypothetical protein
MANTQRHLLIATGWLFGVPLLGVVLALSFGALPGQPLYFSFSALWGLGFLAIFWSWASKDAPDHGRPRAVAVWFTAAWLILFFFAVIPYLFVTRGAKNGLLSSVKFLCLLLVCAIVWLALPTLFRLIS